MARTGPLNYRAGLFISCIARRGPLTSGPGQACLLLAGGFTILRQAHIPNTPTFQLTIDS